MRPGYVLIETKSGSQVGTVDRLLLRLGVRPVTGCSKYALGIALANPALPTNPYRPLLRRYFDLTPVPKPLPTLTDWLPALMSPAPVPAPVERARDRNRKLDRLVAHLEEHTRN